MDGKQYILDLFNPIDRVAVVVDGYGTQLALKTILPQAIIDWNLFRLKFINLCRVVNMAYYSTITVDNPSAHRTTLDWLSLNGYAVKTRVAPPLENTMTHSKVVKGMIEIDIILDTLAIVDHVDMVVIFSHNQELTPLICDLKRRGKAVVLVTNSHSYMEKNKGDSPLSVCACRDLMASPSHFIELATFVQDVVKNAGS